MSDSENREAIHAFAARYAEQAWRLAVVLHAALHGAEAGGQPLTLEWTDGSVPVRAEE